MRVLSVLLIAWQICENMNVLQMVKVSQDDNNSTSWMDVNENYIIFYTKAECGL